MTHAEIWILLGTLVIGFTVGGLFAGCVKELATNREKHLDRIRFEHEAIAAGAGTYEHVPEDDKYYVRQQFVWLTDKKPEHVERP